MSGNASDAINSFNEIIAFLDGVKDSEDLSSIIASIEQQVARKAEDSSVVHKAGKETITGAKTFNSGVNFLGSGDSNAVTLSTNTRINVNGTNQTVLGFGNSNFYINHGNYNLLLRGKATRPTYNNADMALFSDVSGKQDAISDLATIRDGAAKGATALQSVPSEYVTETELNEKGYATTSELTSGLDSKASVTQVESMIAKAITNTLNTEV